MVLWVQGIQGRTHTPDKGCPHTWQDTHPRQGVSSSKAGHTPQTRGVLTHGRTQTPDVGKNQWRNQEMRSNPMTKPSDNSQNIWVVEQTTPSYKNVNNHIVRWKNPKKVIRPDDKTQGKHKTQWPNTNHLGGGDDKAQWHKLNLANKGTHLNELIKLKANKKSQWQNQKPTDIGVWRT